VLERRRAVALAHHVREAEGRSVAQIAGRVGRSPATVKAYFYDPAVREGAGGQDALPGSVPGLRRLHPARNGEGDAYSYCNACHPGAIQARWTRERVLAAMLQWRDRYGRLPSSYDWSRTHARRRGGHALERQSAGDWALGERRHQRVRRLGRGTRRGRVRRRPDLPLEPPVRRAAPCIWVEDPRSGRHVAVGPPAGACPGRSMTVESELSIVEFKRREYSAACMLRATAGLELVSADSSRLVGGAITWTGAFTSRVAAYHGHRGHRRRGPSDHCQARAELPPADARRGRVRAMS
jgi:hypothetical protein